MNKLINKLVTASGGWEYFLYQTLKEVCDDLRPTVVDAGVTGIVDEARDVLKAYEETGAVDTGVDEKKVRPVPAVKTQATVAVEVDEPTESKKNEAGVPINKPVGIKIEDVVLAPVSRPTPKSKKLIGKVGVGKDAGASQGELPMPSRHKMVNRQSITITTNDGLELGRGSEKNGEEGQIRGQHVSGHISATGAFRLVFKDNTLGVSLVNYEVQSLLLKTTKREFERGVAARNKLTVEELHKVLQELDKVVVPYDSGMEGCFGWKIVDQAEVEEAAALQAQKMEARRVANPMAFPGRAG